MIVPWISILEAHGLTPAKASLSTPRPKSKRHLPLGKDRLLDQPLNMTKPLVILFAASLSGCSWLFPLKGKYELVKVRSPESQYQFVDPTEKTTLEIGYKSATLVQEIGKNCKRNSTIGNFSATDTEINVANVAQEDSIECPRPGIMKTENSVVWKYKKHSDGLEINMPSEQITQRWKKID